MHDTVLSYDAACSTVILNNYLHCTMCGAGVGLAETRLSVFPKVGTFFISPAKRSLLDTYLGDATLFYHFHIKTMYSKSNMSSKRYYEKIWC